MIAAARACPIQTVLAAAGWIEMNPSTTAAAQFETPGSDLRGEDSRAPPPTPRCARAIDCEIELPPWSDARSHPPAQGPCSRTAEWWDAALARSTPGKPP